MTACHGCDVREGDPADEFGLCSVCQRNEWTVLRMKGDRLARWLREENSRRSSREGTVE